METITSYGTHGVRVLSPAPAANSGGDVVLGNDKSLSDALDLKLNLAGGSVTGALSVGENLTLGNGVINTDGNTLSLETSGGGVQLDSGTTLDDGSGQMSIAGGLTIGGDLTAESGTATIASISCGGITASDVVTNGINFTGGSSIDGTGSNQIALSGALSMGANHINFQNVTSGISANSGGTLNLGAVLNIQTNGNVNTVHSIFDDGSGNMQIGGKITGSPTLVTVKGITIDGGGSVIPTGVVGSVQIPFNATITGWTVISTDGTSGSITFDVQSCSIGSGVYTNTSGNSIIGTTGSPVHPNLTSQSSNSSSSFTNWTTTNLTAGHYLVIAVTGTPASVISVRIELTLAPR